MHKPCTESQIQAPTTAYTSDNSGAPRPLILRLASASTRACHSSRHNRLLTQFNDTANPVNGTSTGAPNAALSRPPLCVCTCAPAPASWRRTRLATSCSAREPPSLPRCQSWVSAAAPVGAGAGLRVREERVGGSGLAAGWHGGDKVVLVACGACDQLGACGRGDCAQAQHNSGV